MTRNQKIALGCGGGGCLGLIVLAIAGGLIYFYTMRSTRDRYYANYNFNSNRNTNLNTNTNSNDDSTNSSSNSNSSSSSLSDDDKHKLYQAAAITADFELQRRVWVKIGILEEDFSQGDKFTAFAAEHVAWAIRNYQWVGTMDSAAKGRAYINEHLPN
ncbi:MAG TPA: hypothetical protein VJT15_13745 [Pyrinomonadaceae bacterium]|nr:hypothetical protein [Pyrinomonadaceae bacterium]